jgi:1-acyl-sn-glycerol-3-phosphate acyltransferase
LNGLSLQRIRSTLFNGLWAVWTAAFIPVILIIRLAGTPGSWVRAASRVWARGILFGLKWVVGITYTVKGDENRPEGPCLIVANHQSAGETIAFLVLFPEVAIVTKQELLSVPIVSWFLRLSPMIIIDRDSGTRAIRKMMDEGAVALEQGRPVLIFPEGTRSDHLARIEFKRGVELLYARLGHPVLPVALNSGRYWSSDRKVMRAGEIAVSFLPPIEAGMPPQAAMKRAEHLIQEELDRIGGVEARALAS